MQRFSYLCKILQREQQWQKTRDYFAVCVFKVAQEHEEDWVHCKTFMQNIRAVKRALAAFTCSAALDTNIQSANCMAVI